jgi:primosomal protein N' (replication factor Y)
MRLARAEQTLLFLNRRGYSTTLLCTRCGHVAVCPQCSVSVTYHRSDDLLRCHICGNVREVPARCPECEDPAFRFSGIGTQRVENILHRLFPAARIQRMDADSTRGKDAHDRILGEFRKGKIDILIGTQMIAKGLHFPNVTLVGVIHADLSLHVPDFRAGERTFQLLAQVAGRAGRGDVSGEVIVQTYTPFHPSIQAARRLDYEGLCDQESEFRRELRYPPFAHLVRITLKSPSETRAAFCAETLARKLKAAVGDPVIVTDASPAPLRRAKGDYRFHVMLRADSTRQMTGPLRQVLADLSLPPDVSCSVDVDAVNMT